MSDETRESGRDPIYDVLKEMSREKFNKDRADHMKRALARDDGRWTKHTPHHWSRMLAGDRLDFWPSRKKYQFRGKVRRGDVFALIRKHSTEEGQ